MVVAALSSGGSRDQQGGPRRVHPLRHPGGQRVQAVPRREGEARRRPVVGEEPGPGVQVSQDQDGQVSIVLGSLIVSVFAGCLALMSRVRLR